MLWGLWHLPVVDSLRAASPHGRYWPEYFAAFIAVLAAIRVLIAWTYVHTGSLRMDQLLHASSTGFLVILSAPASMWRPSARRTPVAVPWLPVISLICTPQRRSTPCSRCRPAKT